MNSTKQEAGSNMGAIQSLYENMKTERNMFLDRAEECSKYSIPFLIPEEGHSSSTNYYTPYQSIVARGVNNLASKLLLSLLPLNSPFFRLQIDDFTLEELTQQEGLRGKVEESLSKIERAVQGEVEARTIRVATYEALRHLLIGGNSLLYVGDKGAMKTFSLQQYVIQRDSAGNVLTIIVEEKVAPSMLPQNVRDYIMTSNESTESLGNTKDLKVYTHIRLDTEGKGKPRWKVSQEVSGITIPDSEGEYPFDKSPWIPLRFMRISGESYGRGYLEEYLGDIIALEGLSKAILESAAISSKAIFLVRPNGLTSVKAVAKASNGDFVSGSVEDVQALQVSKFNDFSVTMQTANGIEERLAYAFLLNSAIQRSGERVTAEEIRYMAGELESSLGGIYSILSLEFQMPLINRLMHIMEKSKKLPKLPEGTVKPVIIAGMEAIGRGNDYDKLNQFLAFAGQVAQLPPEINKADALTRAGASLGIDTKGLVKSPEELAQEQQQEQMMQLAQQATPAIAQAGGKMMEQQMQEGQPEEG